MEEGAPIYSGPRSCYARNESIYVAPGPMDPARAAAHIYLHLRDLERGWTYDHSCKRIRMTPDLFEARTKYLLKLCKDQCDKVAELVEEVLSTRRLPKWAEELARSKLVKVARLFEA